MAIDRTPEEQRVLDEIAAQTAAGADPFGDDEELVRPGAGGDEPQANADGGQDDAAGDGDGDGAPDEGQPAAGEAAKKDGAEGEQGAQGDGKNDLDPGVLAEIADPLQLRQPQQFQAEAPKDFKEQRAKLLAEKTAAMSKLMNGEIDTEAYAAEEVRIAEALDELTQAKVRAETLLEVNRQNADNYAQLAIDHIITTKKDEIDYTKDKGAAKQFDMAVGMLRSDPENASRSLIDIYEDAHRVVAAMKGIETKQADASTSQAADAGKVPDRRPDGKPPVTLRGLPSAAQADTGNSVEQRLSQLKGPEYEAAWAQLTPAQRLRMLDED